jgi:aryl-alcohol dehydrogenase-like predicted oxidoreductase
MSKSQTALTPDAAQSGTFTLGGDLTIHRMGFGAMRLTGKGIWGPPSDPGEAKKVLKRAIELGINFIDTADAYGPEVSENLIAEALHPYPKGLVIATKGGLTRQGPERWLPVGRPEYLTQCVEMSLRRLRLDCMDLYQLHRIDAKVPVEESLGTLKNLQKAGKIRHIGLSEVSVAEIEQAQKITKIVSVQNIYNLSDRKHDDVVTHCEKHQLGFIPWFPMAGGSIPWPSGTAHRSARSRSRGCCTAPRLFCRSQVLQPSAISRKILPRLTFISNRRNGLRSKNQPDNSVLAWERFARPVESKQDDDTSKNYIHSMARNRFVIQGWGA